MTQLADKADDIELQLKVVGERGVERFYFGSTLLAIIIRAGHQKDGINFFTPHEFSQQLACMSHPASYVILPHVHNVIARSVELTQEVLLIRKGKVRIDLYSSECHYLKSCLLYAGDIILLAYGGHGIKVLEAAEIVEVKQGPYVGEADKTRFTPIEESQVQIVPEWQA